MKGSIESGEDPARTAIRELYEESGIREAEIVSNIGSLVVTQPDQQWHFYVCSAGGLPDEWSHFTEDGGGQQFSFFWHPVDQEPGDDWHPIFKQALRFIRSKIAI